MWSRDEMELAEAFQEISSPTSLVLCSDYHHHWVPSLSGRRVMMGYRGWLSSYGVDYKTVERDVRTMLGGGPDAESLIDRYGVDYVVIGSTEQRDFNANESYFEQRHELILEKAKYKVFAVDREPRSDRP
jgi:uncharacterized membrane protein